MPRTTGALEKDKIKFYTHETNKLSHDGTIFLSEAVILSAIKHRDLNFFLMEDNIFLALTNISAEAIIEVHFGKEPSPATLEICKKRRCPNQGQIDRHNYMVNIVSKLLLQGKSTKEMVDELNVSTAIVNKYKKLANNEGQE